MKTYVNICPGRSGTTSLWYVLKGHREIQNTTRAKELLTEITDFHQYKTYIDSLLVSNILLDASTDLYNRKWLPRLINEINFDRKCFIYIKRNQLDQWRSNALMFIKNGFTSITMDEFKEFDKDKLRKTFNFKTHEQRLQIARAVFDEILIIDFENLENSLDSICDFLNIEHFGKVYFPHFNKNGTI